MPSGLPEWPKCQKKNKRSEVNSSAFYFSTVSPSDWTSPQSDMLWQDDVKTLFDPCPSGWRVPKSGLEEQGLWYHFTLDNSTWNGDENLSATNGRTFDRTVIYGGTCWYPTCGARYERSGTFSYFGSLGFIWSAVATEMAAIDLYFGYKQFTYANTGAARSAGLPVRCIRE